MPRPPLPETGSPFLPFPLQAPRMTQTQVHCSPPRRQRPPPRPAKNHPFPQQLSVLTWPGPEAAALAPASLSSSPSDHRFSPRAPLSMDHHQRRQRQDSPRGNAPRPGSRSGGGASSGRHKGGGCGGKGGGKKPIEFVYISNPLRVKTSAARFRALVQELTGRHADPSKYSPEDPADVDGAGADAAVADIDDAGQGLSPGDAVASSVTAVASPSAAADQQPEATEAAPHGGFYDEDDDGFRSQLLESNYAVFSPPTLLYNYDHRTHN